MAIQFTGLASGLDTQSIVADLMKVERMKVDDIEREKTKLDWTKDIWGEMNTKLYSFYKEELFAFKSQGTYSDKKLSNSNESVISLSDSSSAVNGGHSITINSMAKGSFLSGSQLSDTVTSTTTMAELAGISGSATINIKTNTKAVGDDATTANTFGAGNEITINDTDTVADVVSKIDALGLDLNVSFDDNFHTLFISSTETGEDVELSMTDNGDVNATAVLSSLGFSLAADPDNPGHQLATGTTGQDASFDYNGTTLTSSTNEISVNGLNFNILANSGTADISVNTDTDAIYDSIKSFITKYNEIMVEMTTKLEAESARGYTPLTSDEKSAMSDDEIELWESKIKDSLLRNDSTLTGVRNDLRSMLTVSSGIDTSGLDFNFLSELGIVTGNYTEKGILHIEGDEDDVLYAQKDNKLRDAIDNNLEGVMEFLTKIGGEIYNNMYNKMKSSSISSSLTFYNDKLLDDRMDSFDDDIVRLEERLAAVENRYYKQFTAMEQAIQQSNSTGDWLAQQLSGL